MPTIAAHTLGCKLNFAETSHLLRRFKELGYEVVPYSQSADVYFVNTCTVTAVAEKKCRTAIRQAIRRNPNAIMAVIGCFAQNEASQIAQIPGVDIILGNNLKHNLPQYVEERQSIKGIIQDDSEPKTFQLSYSASDRTRTFFKIQDGCDYFCTYCAIPFARGRSRSASIAETLEVAHQIAETGAKEIVLTGVNTGTFGQSHQEHFIDLLKRLDEIEEIERYRISSIEPNLITEEILEFIQKSRSFAHHFHIPIQAASDPVLKMMHRRYTTAQYAEKIHTIKGLMPDACIAADLMVGFYGETPELFEQGMEFIEQIPISYLHIFTYSERPNTKALSLPGKVPVNERRIRSEKMHQLSLKKRIDFCNSHLGTTQSVLWESSIHSGGTMEGWTGNYIRVKQKFNPQMVNKLTPIVLTEENMVINHEDQ